MMVNRKLNPVRSYFVYEASSNTSTCLIDGCGCSLSGSHASNLERHVKRHHKDTHEKLLGEKKCYIAGLDRPVAKRIKLSDVKVVPSIGPVCSPSVVPTQQVKAKVEASSLLSACTELVVKNGRCLELIDDSGFRKIIDPRNCGENGRTVLNSEGLSRHIQEKAQALRETIKRELSDKIVCLKFDIVTYATYSVIGVNVQFIDKGEVVLRSLAVQRFSQLQTSTYFQVLLMEILKTYGITAAQVLGVTTDNATSLPPCDLSHGFNCNERFGFSSDEEKQSDDKAQASVASSNGRFLDSKPISNNIQSLQGVPCVSYELRSAVDEALGENFVQKLLNKARRLCCQLQKETGTAPKHNDVPALDSPCNWRSTLQMLQKLVALKSVCEEIGAKKSDFSLTSDDWKVVEEITAGLQRVSDAFGSVQDDQSTLGDFYGSLLKYKLQTARQPTTLFGEVLVSAVTATESLLLENDVFVSSIYLDPRYKLLLDESQRQRAQDHLVKTWSMVGGRKTQPPTGCIRVPISMEDELDQLLTQKESEYAKLRASCDVSPERVKALLEAFIDEERLSKEVNVLQYWEQEKASKPELYELAQIVHAVPATEISLQRTTEAVDLSQPDQTSKKSNEIIEDILFLRINSCV